MEKRKSATFSFLFWYEKLRIASSYFGGKPSCGSVHVVLPRGLEESILRSEGGVKTRTLRRRISAPSCLLFPCFKTKSCFVIFRQNDKHLRTNTEEMHRKQVVSLFIIITIVTINCVINAIQQLCKQAVSDAVSYLQYEDNNNDVFTFFVVMDLVFPGILSLLKPPSPRLHRNWFHNGCQTGFARSPASYQSPRNLISRESCLFQEGRGE